MLALEKSTPSLLRLERLPQHVLQRTVTKSVIWSTSLVRLRPITTGKLNSCLLVRPLSHTQFQTHWEPNLKAERPLTVTDTFRSRQLRVKVTPGPKVVTKRSCRMELK